MGFPEDLEEAKSFSFEWVTNPVPLRDEEAASKIVIQRGEFGWLSDKERRNRRPNSRLEN